MIRITGLACRLPGALETPAFRWNQRWPGAPAFGAWLDDPCGFDPAPFGISPYEAARMDPQHRLLLMCARDAVDDAGLAWKDLRGSRTGVWVAMGSQDWVWRTGIRGGHVDAYSVLGNAAGQAAGRIAGLYDLRGPAVVVDAGCAATFVAVEAAARAIAAGTIERALVGAVQVVLAPDGGRMLSAMGVEAEGEVPLPFDPDSPGSVRGEGVGVLVLEAEGRPARTHGWVRACAVAQAGADVRGGVPTARVLADTMRSALHEAGVSPGDVAWVEAHGTGAPAADEAELAAIRAVYPGSVPVGSVKGTIGHLEAAAGMAGIVAALGRGAPGQVVVVNTFGMSGAMGHLVIEVPEASAADALGAPGAGTHFSIQAAITPSPSGGGWPKAGRGKAKLPADESDAGRARIPSTVIGLSAATPTALAATVEAWAERLEMVEERALAALARAAARRPPLPWRVAVSGTDGAALATALRAPRKGTAVRRRPRVGFLYTGQGAQEPGMGRALYAADPAFRAAFDAAEAAFAPLGISVVELCFGGGDLRDTRLAQPALFALQYALTCAWAARGLRPDVVIGHSIGELAAAVAAGALALPDAARLVAARAAAMGALPPGGGMLAILASRDEVAPFLADLPLDVAAVNAPRQVVVAGADEALAVLEERLEDAFLASTRLRTSHAFHSALQAPCLPGFAAAIEGIQARAPKVPWISTATAAVIAEAPDVAYWCAQLRGTVRFHDAVAAAPVDVWVEIGPGDTLCKHARAAGGQAVPSLPRGTPEPDGFAAATATLFGLGLDTLPDDGGIAASAPGYPFELTRFGPEGLVGEVTSEAGDDDPIVIVGLATRLPGCPTVEDLSASLHTPEVSLSEVDGVTAGWMPDARRFDAAAFGVSRREAGWMDPRQGLALELAWEALERSGLATDGAATGVFVGVSGGEPRAYPEEVDPQALTGRVEAAIAGRIAYALGLTGPALCVDAACASSLVALHLAAESVRRGECAQALAGGVQLIGTAHGAALVAATGALSPTGTARPFDAGADGFVRGEGGVFLVVTRQSTARARGLHVWGTLVGSAVGHGGGGGGFTAPDPTGQERVMRAALGGVDPRRVRFVEAHGTGTRLGDPVEAAAIGRVYGGVALGSAKARFGHLEPAAGVLGVARLLLAMAARRLPAQASVRQLHPDVARWGHGVPTGEEAWPTTPDGAPALGAVSAVGLTGTIAHVVVAPGEEVVGGVVEGDRTTLRLPSPAEPSSAPRPPSRRPPPEGEGKTVSTDRPWRIELSARNPGALRSLCDRWAEALAPHHAVADVAWTALRRRMPARRAVVARTIDELRAALLADADAPGGVLPGPEGGHRVLPLPIAAWGGEVWAASPDSPVAPVVVAPSAAPALETLLAELLPGALDAPEVPLADLGLDSLGALVLARAAPTVPAAALRSYTVRALREATAPVTIAPAPAPSVSARPSFTLPDVRLEQLRDGRGLPIVLLHPGGVAPAFWEGLDLGDRPVWLGRSWALEAGEGASLQPYAVAFAAAIGALVPGPVVLAGWSLGGAIAWEVAARREAAGGVVPLVILLDTYGPGVTMPADLGPLSCAWSRAAPEAKGRVDLWRQGLEASARRVAGWAPSPRRGDTVRIQARERHGVAVGWGEVGREVWVDADHYSIVAGAARAETARAVRGALAAVEAWS